MATTNKTIKEGFRVNMYLLELNTFMRKMTMVSTIHSELIFLASLFFPVSTVDAKNTISTS